MFLPLLLASTGLVCSILGILLIRAMSSRRPAVALRSGTMAAPIILIAASFVLLGSVSTSGGRCSAAPWAASLSDW